MIIYIYIYTTYDVQAKRELLHVVGQDHMLMTLQ